MQNLIATFEAWLDRGFWKISFGFYSSVRLKVYGFSILIWYDRQTGIVSYIHGFQKNHFALRSEVKFSGFASYVLK